MSDYLVTHNGYYHADDVLAVSIIKKLHPELEIIRTRDEKLFNDAKFVVDVGAVYHAKKGRFDHHQKDGPLRSDEDETPYSAFGLVWRTLGRSYLKKLYPEANQSKIDFIWTKMDKSFVMEIDKNDNGRQPVMVGHFASIIGTMNDIKSFEEMLPFADMTLYGLAEKLSQRYDARFIVEEACKNQIFPGVIELPKGMQWKSMVSDDILFAIFPSEDVWYIGTTSLPDEPMTPKMPLLSEWCGKRDEELDAVSGINGCVFVHNSGFIGANKTREGAFSMVVETINSHMPKFKI